MDIKAVLPMLALSLTACGGAPPKPQPIPAAPAVRLCPAPPVPPAELMVPPRKMDFLSPSA